MEIIREKRKSDIACANTLYNKKYRGGTYHWHESIEMCFIKKGDLSFFADGEYISSHTGDVVVFGEYSVHRFLQPENFCELCLCQLPIRILLIPGVTIKPLKTHIKAYEIESIPGLREQLDQILEMLSKEGRCMKSEENPYFRTAAASLYFLLMRHFPGSETLTVNKKERNEFYRITEYINSHYTENINVSSVANALCIHRGKVSEIFSKYAEISINAYINSLRINHSNNLLKNGYSVTDAAFESGFSSIRTFNNAYKKATGITPTEYLSNNRRT